VTGESIAPGHVRLHYVLISPVLKQEAQQRVKPPPTGIHDWPLFMRVTHRRTYQSGRCLTGILECLALVFRIVNDRATVLMNSQVGFQKPSGATVAGISTSTDRQTHSMDSYEEYHIFPVSFTNTALN
jgi:hypothetical protein